MAQLGDSAKPALANWEAWDSVGSYNQAGQPHTMPERGRIITLGGWCAGVSESVSTRLVLWSAAGAVLGQSAAFTMAGQSPGQGHVANYEADLTTPVDVDAGVTVYVGLAHDPAKSHQLTGRSTAAGQLHYDNHRGTWPGTLIPGDTGGHGFGNYSIGFYIANYATIGGAWIYRGGTWRSADGVYAYRGGAWLQVDNVAVYRSSIWQDAD